MPKWRSVSDLIDWRSIIQVVVLNKRNNLKTTTDYISPSDEQTKSLAQKGTFSAKNFAKI